MSKLYSYADIAGWVGLSRQAVAKAFKMAPRSAAKVGRKVDVEHQEAVQWLEERGVDPTLIEPATKTPRSAKEIAKDLSESDASEPLDPILDMTLRQLTERHGTTPEMVDWLKARKELAAAMRQEHLLDETKGRLIEKDFVRTHLFGLLEELSQRLLTDAARTLTRRVYSAARSDVPLEEAQEVARDILSQNLQRAQEQAKKKLKP